MSIERNLLISILKLTKNEVALIKDVNIDARLPTELSCTLLQKLQNQQLIYLSDEKIELNSNNRIQLAAKAISLGADVEKISNLLCWQEFEKIAGVSLQNNGYNIQTNVRFTHEKRRWEIDVVGYKKPLVICIDCKHWGHSIAASALSKIVDAQIDRTEAFANSFPNIKEKAPCTQWQRAKFIPVVLSLVQSAYKFVHEVPVVPVLRLQDFINQVPLYTQELMYVSKTFASLAHDF